VRGARGHRATARGMTHRSPPCVLLSHAPLFRAPCLLLGLCRPRLEDTAKPPRRLEPSRQTAACGGHARSARTSKQDKHHSRYVGSPPAALRWLSAPFGRASAVCSPLHCCSLARFGVHDAPSDEWHRLVGSMELSGAAANTALVLLASRPPSSTALALSAVRQSLFPAPAAATTHRCATDDALLSASTLAAHTRRRCVCSCLVAFCFGATRSSS
jgi:hypothetical protein